MDNTQLVPGVATSGNAASTLSVCDVLQDPVVANWMSIGVPQGLGGRGGSLLDLHRVGHELTTLSMPPHALSLLKVQRLVIEALLLSRNVAQQEYLIPPLLQGERAGSINIRTEPLSGVRGSRGWLLSGRIDSLVNLDWAGFSVVTPVLLGTNELGWAVLRGEEDGLAVNAPVINRHLQHEWRTGSVVACDVLFRREEWLGGTELTPLLEQARWQLDSALFDLKQGRQHVSL